MLFFRKLMNCLGDSFQGRRAGDAVRRCPAVILRCFRLATRTIKNSSRLELKMARNFTRSRSGTEGSLASSKTRRLNSSHERSRLINKLCSSFIKGSKNSQPNSHCQCRSIPMTVWKSRVDRRPDLHLDGRYSWLLVRGEHQWYSALLKP